MSKISFNQFIQLDSSNKMGGVSMKLFTKLTMTFQNFRTNKRPLITQQVFIFVAGIPRGTKLYIMKNNLSNLNFHPVPC